jgi:dTDP-glucose 4,6-dehydratase
MKLLVTGGAGFIGSNLVHYLLGPASAETGKPIDLVVNLDKLTYAGNLENLAPIAHEARHIFVQGDIMDTALVRQLLSDHKIDAIMHLAAESHVDRSIDAPEDFIQTNFVGTFRLLEAARDHARSHPGFRFLHVSTDEVFGTLRPEDPAFSETTPYAPNSAYSASKAGSDFLARAYHHTYGLDVVTTNCSNNYGPYQFPEKLVPLMIRKISRGEALPVYGDGQQVRDWLYVEDHCRGLLLALLKGRSGETYCLGGRSEKPNLEVVHTLISLVTAKLPADQRRAAADLITYVKDRPGHDRRYAIDCSKSERELGWSPHENFASGMARTVDWYHTHESWVSRIEAGTYRQERLGTSAA